jgi:hypothetical protein
MKKSFTVILLIVMTILLHGQDQVAIERIPFELKGEYVIFKMTINQADTIDCIFDTGATSGVMVLNKRAAQELGISSNKSVSATGGGGSVKDVQKVKGNSIRVNHLEIKNITFYCIPLEHLELESGIKIDAIIGDVFLTRYVVKINYDNHLIELYPKKNFQYSGDGKKIPIKIMPLLHLSYLEGNVQFDDGTSLNGKFLIDSGAAHALIFSSPFSKSNLLNSKFSKLFTYQSKGLSEDEIEMNVGRLKQFSSGEISINSFPVSISNARKGVLSWKKFAGIIGNKILMKYNITYDYDRKITYWETNRYTNVPIKNNCAGFEVSYSDASYSKIIVSQLFESSPAKKAGIMINDEIISINNQRAQSLGVLGISNKLQEPDSEMEIAVRRNNENINLNIVLEPFI